MSHISAKLNTEEKFEKSAIAKEIEAARKTGSMRDGYSLVELMLIIVIIAVMIDGIYTSFHKIYLSTQADRVVKKVSTVVAGIERVESRNGGVYPAYSGNIVNDTLLKNSLGGTKGTKDIQNWTYACTAGSDTTLTVTTEPMDNGEKADLVVSDLNNEIVPWTASKGSNDEIIITRNHVTCQ